jgi:wyosine [tRNA(Phe)-imidazoG37] synthetase (radical SAM superfamily)
MFKYLFGPVPSRRLGISLGVELVPKKVCSLNCIYCQIGETTKLTLNRKEYVSLEKIQEELSIYFNNNPDPDFITFSGSGEPTLNIRIGDIIQFIKQKKPLIPVCVITNGTLLYVKNVRNALKDADLVLPSLDAATVDMFRKINFPHKDLTIEKYIQGLISFRREFQGKIWLEIFILPGYNDTDHELIALKAAIQKINPDLVQLNSLDRPGRIADLPVASIEELQRVHDFWSMDNVEIIAALRDRKTIHSYRIDTETAILETIARRPCTLDDLSNILGIHLNEINKYLDVLEAEHKIKTSRQKRGIFYFKSN